MQAPTHRRPEPARRRSQPADSRRRRLAGPAQPAKYQPPASTIAVLLSMTGFGEAHRQQDGLAVAVEVRTINSRFFKLSIRTSEGYGPLEPRIEAVVRQSIRRGTVQVNLRVDRLRSPDDFKINADVLDRYRSQLQALVPAVEL